MGSQRNFPDLNTYQKEVLIGTILGDATLEKNGEYTRVKIAQGIKEKEYAFWKYKVFKNLTSGSFWLCFQKDIRLGKKDHKTWRFNTVSSPIFDPFREIFYQGKNKKIPMDIINYLRSPISLAVWYMDDGGRRTDCLALRLSTHCFPWDEQKLLQECLRKNYAIKANIHRVSGNTFQLYVPSNEAKKFSQIVKPHIIPSMKYKLL